MNSNPPPSQLHFFCEAPFKGFARVEGIATIDEHGVTFDYAMTENVGSPPRGAVSRRLSFNDVSSIELRKHWLSASRLRFRAKNLQAIDNYPTTDPSVFEIEVAAISRSELAEFHLALQTRFEQHLKSQQAAG
jgi:hypothetical protein